MDLEGVVVESGGRTIPAVTGLARNRARYKPTDRVGAYKKFAHKRHRRAWRVWCQTGAPESEEPVLRPTTDWDIW